jgi:dehydrogenase/reductase SDR family member 7B
MADAREGQGSVDATMAWVGKMVHVNLLSYIYLSSYALPPLSLSDADGGGRIVVVGSLVGRVAMPRTAPYASTKHAVFGYFDSLRHDLLSSTDPALARVGITTGVLGSFDTENTKALAGSKMDPAKSFVEWHAPQMASRALVSAAARGHDTVFVPWTQTRLVCLLSPLLTRPLGWLLRTVALHGEL